MASSGFLVFPAAPEGDYWVVETDAPTGFHTAPPTLVRHELTEGPRDCLVVGDRRACAPDDDQSGGSCWYMSTTRQPTSRGPMRGTLARSSRGRTPSKRVGAAWTRRGKRGCLRARPSRAFRAWNAGEPGRTRTFNQVIKSPGDDVHGRRSMRELYGPRRAERACPPTPSLRARPRRSRCTRMLRLNGCPCRRCPGRRSTSERRFLKYALPQCPRMRSSSAVASDDEGGATGVGRPGSAPEARRDLQADDSRS